MHSERSNRGVLCVTSKFVPSSPHKELISCNAEDDNNNNNKARKLHNIINTIPSLVVIEEGHCEEKEQDASTDVTNITTNLTTNHISFSADCSNKSSYNQYSNINHKNHTYLISSNIKEGEAVDTDEKTESQQVTKLYDTLVCETLDEILNGTAELTGFKSSIYDRKWSWLLKYFEKSFNDGKINMQFIFLSLSKVILLVP